MKNRFGRYNYFYIQPRLESSRVEFRKTKTSISKLDRNFIAVRSILFHKSGKKLDRRRFNKQVKWKEQDVTPKPILGKRC